MPSKIYQPILGSDRAFLVISNFEDPADVVPVGEMSVLEALAHVVARDSELVYPRNWGLAVGDFQFGWDDESEGFVGYDESLPPAASLGDVVRDLQDGVERSYNDEQIDTEVWLRLEDGQLDATGPWPGGRPDED